MLTIYRNNLYSLYIHGFQNTVKSISNLKVFILIVPISVVLCLLPLLTACFPISGTLQNSDIFSLRNFVWSRCM